ncbi:thioredoxin family protein [Clostridium sp. NSJ-49]|uniref:Thioredoxin domain-containing protein n=1 Tax=Clostridium disporicum TaxID=84024 RepID=A0A174BRG1_9CLOT|nr:thioredoxin family protein [Clostridium disporicum]MBC5624270.1 thioredoxin family protein [Clostridium sp. NSJ-49]MDU6340229.1 thioredoxin family protein [Clostridium sp.]CUO02779.1 thioredoxin domain-containing protein [Clostridium disporicum]
MINIENPKEVEEVIENNKMSIIYFTGSACGACEVIKEKLESILNEFPKIECREVNGEKHIDLAAKYGIFSLPIMLLFIEGKEFLRVGRNVNLLELKNNFERYYNMIY